MSGYELDDPKHETYPERLADLVDTERKREKEEGPMQPDTTSTAVSGSAYQQRRAAYPPEQKALHAALAKAQGEFPPIAREKTVTVQTKTGGSYEFAYAPLDVILAAVRPILSKHGLALIQRLESPNGQPAIRTELLHADGAAIAASFLLGPMPNSPQQLGSLLTYLRRYAVVALLGIAAEEDDDARQASGPAQAAAAGPDPDPSPFQPPDTMRPDDGGAALLSDPQRKKIYALKTKLVKQGAFIEEEFALVLGAEYGTESVAELTKAQASQLIERLVAKETELEGAA